MTGSFERAVAAVVPLHAGAVEDARALQDRLTKPPGSLGRLEDLGAQLCGIYGRCPPPVPRPAAVAVFAGDHGVLAEGVTPWPREVTAQMVANIAAGGAAINVMAGQAGASVTVVDVGVATPLPAGPPVGAIGTVLGRRVRAGTGNLANEPAMSMEECRAALDAGAEVAASLAAVGTNALVTGEMGIGNTTPAAAVIAALTGRAAGDVTGRGTGIDDATFSRKVEVVEAALARHADAVAAGVVPTLAALGGLELVALVGFVVGGAAAGLPVVVDGVTADAALLAAEALAPGTRARCVAGHRSVEPGAAVALEALGMEPVLDLRLRLGEGTGACLALPLLEVAARVLGEMATFDAAGVSEKRG